MVNEHLSAEEVIWCEQLVQEIAAIVREENRATSYLCWMKPDTLSL